MKILSKIIKIPIPNMSLVVYKTTSKLEVRQMDKALVVSLIFCLVSLIYILIGYYGLSLNLKRKINIIFFTMASSLSFWAITYAMATNASSIEEAILFNKISVLGWGPYYGLIYHFTKLLSNKKNSFSLKHYILVYSPPIFFIANILVFNTNLYKFSVIKTQWGYTVLTSFNWFNLLINIYSMFLILLATVTVIKWYKKVNDKKLKSLIRITLYLCILSIIVSIICDTVILRLLGIPAIQSIVIWILLPTLFFYYVLLKSKLMHPEIKTDYKELIDSSSKKRLFRLFGYIYVGLAYLTFSMHFLNKVYLKENQLIISFILMVVAFIHFFISDLIKKEEHQYVIISVLYILMMAFLSRVYTESFFSVIWALFFCYMLLTVTFKNYICSFLMYGFVVILQTAIYINSDKNFNLVFTSWDYFIRMLIITLFSILALYINYAYRKRISENSIQMEKQEIVKDFSSRMLDINVYNYEEKIIDLLCLVARGFHVKCSYYLRYLPNEDKILDSVVLTDGQTVTRESSLASTIFEYNNGFLKKLYNGEKIDIFNIDFKKESDDLKQIFYSRGINSFYAFPVKVKDNLRGIVAFECVFDEHSKLLHFYLDTFQNLNTDAINKLDSERDLFQKANFDVVTGLINKQYFIKNAGELLNNSGESKSYCIYLDIDDFKSVNDTFGHLLGDELLKETANIIKNISSKKSMITRFTGDEFAIFYPNIEDRATVESYLNQIVEEFKSGVKVYQNNFRINISIGISEYPKDGGSIEELLRSADLAMHKSKNLGYMRYHFCDDIDKKNILEDSIYTNRLYSALDKGEFIMAYQPQIDNKTEKVIGMEALLRWDSPDLGLVSPNNFIHILEKTGLIVSISEWIIEECMREQKRLSELGYPDLKISINLSAVQFMDTSLISTIEQLKNKYDIDSRYIEFEITESIAINNSTFIIDTFKKIKDLGFSIAIDDFGTGFSSLNRIQNLPIDRLKIDKSFIDGINKNAKQEAIINVIIGLAKNLGIHSIAEGVETKEQLDYLRVYGCEEIQGYYYAKPMFPDDLIKYMESMI